MGKLTGNAIRVPAPNVSMAVLNLELETEVTKDEVNDHLRNENGYLPPAGAPIGACNRGDKENRGFRISGPAVSLVVPVKIFLLN